MCFAIMDGLMMFIATILPKVFEGIITTLCIQVHQSSERLPTYICAISWALSLSKLLLHSWMCEYWVRFCIQCFRFGKKHFIWCMLDFAGDRYWCCWLRDISGWEMSYQSQCGLTQYPIFHFTLMPSRSFLNSFLFVFFIKLSNGFCQLTLHIVFQSTWRTHWGEGVDDGCHTQGLLENEYTGVTFPSNIPNAPAISPQVTLQTTFQVPKARIGKWENILILAGMAIGYRVLTSISLILFQALTLHKHTTSRTSSRPSQDE